MSAQHTPGPWTASADSSFIRDSRGVGIAKVYAWCGRSGDGPLPHRANGELIASAPAMRERIEALEKLSVSLSTALKAIADMKVTATTDHKQLSALMLAIAKQALAGAI